MNLPFDKYEFYRLGVQSPDTDAELFKTLYKDLTGKELLTLGEDFCGTFAISCEWVKMNPQHKSVSVDLSSEPLDYGKSHYLSQLSQDQQSRMQIVNSNVLNPELPQADCIAAMNFSYFIFKTRAELKAYFENCYRRLPEGGLLICDSFGGAETLQCVEEETEVEEGNFSVFWDQEWYDPINNHAQFHLHFQPNGGKKYLRVFSYNWRMWSIPEIREVMVEAGFKTTTVHWEGSDDEEGGRGNGIYTQTESTKEEVDSWIALIAAQK